MWASIPVFRNFMQPQNMYFKLPLVVNKSYRYLFYLRPIFAFLLYFTYDDLKSHA